MNVSMVSEKNGSEAGWPREVVSDYHVSTNLQLVEMISLATIFLLAVLGNGVVLLAIYGKQRSEKVKLSRVHFFILHLTIADLVTAVLNVLPQLLWKMTYRFAGGPPLCKAVKFVQTLGPYLISYVLVATAIDRYQAVCQPLLYSVSSSRRSRTMLCLAWVLSLVFCIPQVTIFSYQELSPAVHDCWASFARPWGERIYVTWYSVSVYIVPLILMLGLYSRIYQKIWQSPGHHSDPVLTKARVNTIRQTGAVLVVYIACSTPFTCALLWASWDNDAHFSNMWSGSTLTLLTLLSSINSCVNPLLYIAFNPALRRSLAALCSNCSRTRLPLPTRSEQDVERKLRSLRTIDEVDETRSDEAQCFNSNTI